MLSKKFFKSKNFIFFIGITITIICLAFIKHRTGNYNFLCSNASYHILLTMTAYDTVPFSVHKLLPTVSIEPYVPWSTATVEAAGGHYFYASFSPLGFIAPYLFIKLFNLAISLDSLYIFNTILFIAGSYIWYLILDRFFDNKVSVFVGLLVYMFSPELLHGFGIVYWHQSLFQVFFLLQIYCYLRKEDKKYKKLFYFLCFLNPLIEWTAYVANAAFVVTEFIKTKKGEGKYKSILLIIGLTALSGAAFIVHYLTVLTPEQFFTLLLERFLGRSAVVHDIGIGVWVICIFASFMAFICLPLILMFILIIVADKAKVKWGKSLVLRNNLWLLLIFLIPLIENIIMNQHAIAYSYDRMKMVFILSFFIADLVNVFVKIGYKKVISIVVAICILTSGLNLYLYKTSKYYTWDSEYLVQNKEIATTIKDSYSDDEYILGTNAEMGGYLNLLFNRGIHELTTREELTQIAKDNNKAYAIYLDAIDTPWAQYWNMAEITDFEVIEITE